MIGTWIMGGALKRQKIGPIPSNIFARPILARIKKSLFDILMPRLAGSTFLDLFTGSGTVGFEAVSRGAKKVVFIDANPQCERWIKGQLEKFSTRAPELFQAGTHTFHRANIRSGLGWLNEKFDIIFSGAPYVDEKKKALYFITDLLKMVDQDQILKVGGWFVAQHHIKEPFETPKSFKFFRQEKYGDSVLSFFEYTGHV